MYFCCITFAYNLLSSMMRAIGNSYIPLYALVIAQAFSVLFLILYIIKCCPMLHINFREFLVDKMILVELLTTGFSMAMMLVLTNVGTVILQGSINSFGTVWSAFALIIVLICGSELIHALTGSIDEAVINTSMKYLYWNVPFYVVLNILLIMRNSLQALGNKLLPVVLAGCIHKMKKIKSSNE